MVGVVALNLAGEPRARKAAVLDSDRPEPRLIPGEPAHELQRLISRDRGVAREDRRAHQAGVSHRFREGRADRVGHPVGAVGELAGLLLELCGLLRVGHLRRLFGEEHHLTLLTMVNLASILEELGELRNDLDRVAGRLVHLFEEHVWKPFADAGMPADELPRVTEALQDFAVAARALGASPSRVVWHHLAPATLGFVRMQALQLLPAAIADVLPASTSKPVTVKPARANSTASGRPT